MPPGARAHGAAASPVPAVSTAAKRESGWPSSWTGSQDLTPDKAIRKRLAEQPQGPLPVGDVGLVR